MGDSSLDLFVESEKNHNIINEAVTSSKRNDINLKKISASSNLAGEDTNHLSRIGTKRRTPSPLREAMESMKKLKQFYSQQGEEEEAITTNIPQQLHPIVDTSNYELKKFIANNLLQNVTSTEEADDCMKNIIAPRFLEAVILFKHNWILATQFEVYYRNNPAIDESAVVSMMDKYTKNPAAKIKVKTERGKSWYEVSLFWGRFELLITGGITGSRVSNDQSSFLGPSIPLKEMIDGGSTMSEKIYTCSNLNGAEATHYQVRNLRNWTKPSSALELALVSKTLYDKGFNTVDPFDMRNGTSQLVITSLTL